MYDSRRLLEIGSDPSNKNKKFQTPYAAANDKETRIAFRRFMGANPNKFNYTKVYYYYDVSLCMYYDAFISNCAYRTQSQIPGPLTDEIEQEELEKKRQTRKVKREKDKVKRKEFELKKQEENTKQRFLHLSDREKVYILWAIIVLN